MRRLLSYFLKGLTAVLPAAATLYVLWWLGSTAERLLGQLLRFLLPDVLYFPGLGLAFGVALMVGVGMLANAWILRKLASLAEQLVERTPLVKTIYGAFRDVLSLFGGDGDSRMHAVVAVAVGDLRLVGFVTRESVEEILGEEGSDRVAVYLPMAYQIGGYMVLVPREKITRLDMDVESGLRLALTAGVQKAQGG